MNFHKTIGYLAALLLMVGLGVPDSFAQTVKSVDVVSVTPAKVRDDAGATLTVTVTVKVTLTKAVTVATTQPVTVTLSDVNDSYSGHPSDNDNVTIAVHSDNGTGDIELTFTPEDDNDGDTDIITVTATSGGKSDTGTFQLTDYSADYPKNAVDAVGFRVIIASPGDGPDDWAKADKNSVKVQVLRKDGPSSQWGNFSSIKVSLFNDPQDDGDGDGDMTNDEELYAFSVVEGTDNQLSNLAFSRVKTDSLTSSTAFGDIGPVGDSKNATINQRTTTNIPAYKRRSRAGRDDVMEFRFNIDDPSEDLLGPPDVTNVYAIATFVSGGVDALGDDVTVSIESRDTKTSIFPQSPSDFSEVVGDGKSIQIDRDIPLTSVIQDLSVEIGNKGEAKTPAAADGYAGIGMMIVTNASISGAFREAKVVLDIITPEAKGTDPDIVIDANGALVGYKNEVTATTIFTLGNSLRDSVQVAENALLRKYTASDPSDDDAFRKNDTIPVDGVSVRVRANVVDKAGNSRPQYAETEAALNSPDGENVAAEADGDGLSGRFLLDNKRPVVKVLYPKPSVADSATFTARKSMLYTFLGEGEETQNLKPMNFEVHEAVSKGWIVIGVVGKTGGTGPDTLNVVAFDGEALDDGDDNTVDGYDITTLTLKNPDKIPHDVAANKGKNKKPEDDPGAPGLKADVTVVMFDRAGNKGSASPDGGQPHFDSKNPTVNEAKFFPRADALENNKIGGPEGTQHPVFRVDEKVDSILVRYEGGDGVLDVGIGGANATSKAPKQNIRVKFLGDQALQEGETYNLQVYVRDLAGHVDLSKQQDGLTFENDLMNPQAGAFKVYSHVRDNTQGKGIQDHRSYGNDEGKIATGQMDSVVAGQPLRLTVVAVDATTDKITAITYANDGVKVVAMDSEGNMIPSATFWGGGVTNNGDGSATLDSDGWTIGERNLFLRLTEEMNGVTVAVRDVTADGVVNFMGTKEGITVDAADFREFSLIPREDGEVASEVWGDFDLEVTPIDAFGNPSLKTFFAQSPKTGGADSLNILDSRLAKAFLGNAKNTAKKYSSVDVDFSSTLIEDLPFSWTLDLDGQSFPIIALNRPGKSALVRVRIDNTFIDEGDTRSRNLSSDETIKINQPVDISITLWVPGAEGDQAGNEVTIPAGGTVTVTARAEGLNEDDMVTFTVDGEAQDAVAADADGYAGQPIELSGSGTVSVKATSGQYSASLDVVYEEAPAEEGRVKYVDAEGNDVYLVATDDMTVNEGDIVAFVSAFNSSKGEDAYNVQADVDGDGDVDEDDFVIIVTSWGRTATGPATKPLVLLPGINENAEFSLSLGSERVIAGELVAVDVSLANVAALMGYGFKLNYETDKFEFVSFAPADEDLLKSTGGETLSHHVVTDGQIAVVTGMYNGTAVSGGGDIVRFVFRVLREFEDNARFEIADGLVFDPSQLQNPAVVAGVLELQSTPREFALHQNFPNPFNPDTTIKYDLAESADVTLQIYNVLGQVVRTLVASEAQNAGRYQIRWNGMDDRGVSVSSGIYFYRISAGEFQNVRKLMLLK